MIGEKLGYSTFPPAPITGADSPIAFTHARRQPVGQTLQNVGEPAVIERNTKG